MLLPPSAPADFAAILDRFPSVGAEVYHAEDIYAWNPNDITQAHMKKVGGGYTVLPFDRMPTPWTKAILQQERDVLRPVQQWLLERWGDRYEAIFSNNYYLEITAKGSTKGDFVAKVADMLDIRPENLYCVGDNQNDLSMLRRSSIPFAPANCAPEVKQWGARILGACEESCVAQIVDILDHIYA